MPKILWMSPYCLHDTSSGASINAFQMLQYLQKCGMEVWSCSGFCCDTNNGSQVLFKQLKVDHKMVGNRILTLDDKGIHFVFCPTKSTTEMEMTIGECAVFYHVYCSILNEFKPDIVLGYGLSPLPMICREEARRRGITSLHLLYNGEQKGFHFKHFDMVLTDAYATADLYGNSDLINVFAGGIFFNREQYISPIRKPNFVTMINPSVSKGVSFFAKILSICEKEMPEVKFLNIESRSNFYPVMQMLHSKDNPDEHPFANRLFKNLMVLPIQSNMKNVYAITKALIVPSLWFESWGRVSSEAVLNNIPVLSSMSGGIPEAIGKAGISIETPKHCQKDYFSVPTDEEIRPWVDALKKILETDWSEQLAITQVSLSPKSSTLRVCKLLHRLRPKDFPDTGINIPFNPENLNEIEAPILLGFAPNKADSTTPILTEAANRSGLNTQLVDALDAMGAGTPSYKPKAATDATNAADTQDASQESSVNTISSKQSSHPRHYFVKPHTASLGNFGQTQPCAIFDSFAGEKALIIPSQVPYAPFQGVAGQDNAQAKAQDSALQDSPLFSSDLVMQLASINDFNGFIEESDPDEAETDVVPLNGLPVMIHDPTLTDEVIAAFSQAGMPTDVLLEPDYLLQNQSQLCLGGNLDLSEVKVYNCPETSSLTNMDEFVDQCNAMDVESMLSVVQRAVNFGK